MRIFNIIWILVMLSSTLVNAQSSTDNSYLDINNEIEVIQILDGLVEDDTVFPIEEETDTSIEEINKVPNVEIVKFDENGLMLKEGIYSEQVFRIESFFKTKGYIDIVEDYFFDNLTKSVVIDYQQKNGLTPDGAIGINTYNKINEDMEINNIIIAEREIKFTADIPMGNWILINKSNNTLYHFIGNTIIRRYPVATGKTPSYTPEGKFTIVSKSINPAWGGAGRYTPVRGGAPNNPLGKRWMGLSIKGGGWYGIHGNSDSGSIGRYISLGCIRMINEDVEYLYELIELGTPVWIGNEIRLGEYGIEFY